MRNKSIILLQSPHDVEAYPYHADKADVIWPVNPLTWTAAHEAGLIPGDAGGHVHLFGGSGPRAGEIDFEKTWSAFSHFIDTLGELFGGRAEWPGFRDVLTLSAKLECWNLVHEFNYSTGILQALLDANAEADSMAAFHQYANRYPGAPAFNLAARAFASKNNIAFALHPAPSKAAERKLMSGPNFDSQGCSDLVLTFAIPDLSDRLICQAKTNRTTCVLVAQHELIAAPMIGDICGRFDNLKLCVIPNDAVHAIMEKTSALFQESAEVTTAIWDDIDKDEMVPALIQGYFFDRLPLRFGVYAFVRVFAAAGRFERFIFANHADPSTVALQREAELQDIDVEKIEHSYWPLIPEYTLPDGKSEVRLFHLRSAMEHEKNTGNGSASFELKPAMTLRPDLFQRMKRLARCMPRFRARSLGVVITTGQLHIAHDTDLYSALKELVLGLQGANPKRKTQIIFRYREVETSQSQIASLLAELGFDLEKYSVRIEGMQHCSILDFAQRCDTVIELGVASSAWAYVASTSRPYVRITQQPDIRRRFQARSVPVLSPIELDKLMGSWRRRVSLGLKQHWAYLRETGGLGLFPGKTREPV